MTEESLRAEVERLKRLNEQLVIENLELRKSISAPVESLFDYTAPPTSSQEDVIAVTNNSTPGEKIDLFMSLFRGRTDVFPRRWYNSKSGKAGYSPACGNEWLQGICNKPQIKCKDCANRDFIPMTRGVINHHLRNEDKNGVGIAGVYPLLSSDTCYFLAVDFDKENWQDDIAVFREVCKQNGICVTIERSRSGDGGHAWIFFNDAIPAATARKLGSSLLTKAMALRHQIRFTSYDRMFPNQDFMPRGGFGNLIALPLQKGARRASNSEFVDEGFISYPDQWAYLSSLKRLTLADVERHILNLALDGELGVLAQDSSEESVKPWEKSRPVSGLQAEDFPVKVKITSANMLYIEKDGVSQKALNRIKRLAAFKNPEFYKAQAMRLSTHDKPRIIFTLDDSPEYLGIPRGCKDALLNLLEEAEANYSIDDKRNSGVPIGVEFSGSLREEQALAAQILLKYENGVLCATTAFGKTVIGAYLISQRKTNALILVHTQALLSQWKKALTQFLVIDEAIPESPAKRGRKKEPDMIGQLGAGKNALNGVVDVAVMQSLFVGDEVKDLVKDYGLVIVDECHHVSAFSFEKILKNINAKYVYGLTATPNRQDGRHPIIFMQCGEIRYKVDAKLQAEKRSFAHYIVPCFTTFKKPATQNESSWSISQIYNELCEDEPRNRQIITDILNAVENGRTPLVLTERSAHVAGLSAILQVHCKNVIALTGKASVKEKREAMERLASVPKDEELILIATGKYLGEGFDFPRLDTLFLATPISWKGTIAQYAGRLHREYEGKREVIIFDYVDANVAVLDKMYHKRVRGYAQIGYRAMTGWNAHEQDSLIYDVNSFAPVMAEDFANAAKEIIVISPFMRNGRVAQVIQWFLPARLNNIKIVVITRTSESFKEKDRPAVIACVEVLKSAGVQVIEKPELHQKFIIIDRKTVWYGSINLLSYGSSEENIIRLESCALASELLGTL